MTHNFNQRCPTCERLQCVCKIHPRLSTGVMYMSKDPTWATPDYIVEWCMNRFQMGHPYTLDAAASKDNKKAVCFFSKEHSALDHDWAASRIWLNPPYGRQISKFTERAIQQLRSEIPNSSVTLLVPARTDTKWWFDLIQNPLKKHIVFIKGRVKFGNAKGSAPFPSALVHIESIHGPITTSFEVVE
jgi:phage N-6-adenine-methyltransferase